MNLGFVRRRKVGEGADKLVARWADGNSPVMEASRGEPVRKWRGGFVESDLPSIRRTLQASYLWMCSALACSAYEATYRCVSKELFLLACVKVSKSQSKDKK